MPHKNERRKLSQNPGRIWVGACFTHNLGIASQRWQKLGARHLEGHRGLRRLELIAEIVEPAPTIIDIEKPGCRLVNAPPASTGPNQKARNRASFGETAYLAAKATGACAMCRNTATVFLSRCIDYHNYLLA